MLQIVCAITVCEFVHLMEQVSWKLPTPEGGGTPPKPPLLAQRDDFSPNLMCDCERSSTSICTDHRCSVRNSIAPVAAADLVPDGATVMIGGFMGVGSPNRIIDALVSRGGLVHGCGGCPGG